MSVILAKTKLLRESVNSPYHLGTTELKNALVDVYTQKDLPLITQSLCVQACRGHTPSLLTPREAECPMGGTNPSIYPMGT